MLKKTFLASLLGLSLGFVTYVPTLEAQTPDRSSDNSSSVMKGLSLVEPSAAGTLPTVDLNNLQTPKGKLENPEILKKKSHEKTLDFVNSLTEAQRAKIKAILDDNKANFKTQVDQLKQATKDKNSVPDLGLLKDVSKSTDDLITQVNDEIKGVLTKQQRAKFEDTLPQRLNLEEPGASTKMNATYCYYAYYYYYNYAYYYAYYAYLYGYYNYYYYGSGDPADYEAYQLAYNAYNYGYYAYLYAYYAYYYNDSGYAYYAWYFSDHVRDFAETGSALAYRSYWWTGNTYAYYTYLYGYYSWYWTYYYADYYAYYCYNS